MRTFSKDWLAKNAYVKRGQICRSQTRKFASHALKKIGAEMAVRAETSAI
jgi:hypothetical protein